MEKVSLEAKFAGFEEVWSPKVVGALNGQLVKVLKARGDYVWHQHDTEDELFWVVRGSMRIELRGRDVELGPGEFFIVPRGVEHRPVVDDYAEVVLFEPDTTRNTGQVDHDYTIEPQDLDCI